MNSFTVPTKTKYYDVLTLKEKMTNQEFFERMSKITKMFIWSDYGEYIEINTDNKFICNQKQAILFIKNTTPRWFKENVIVQK